MLHHGIEVFQCRPIAVRPGPPATLQTSAWTRESPGFILPELRREIEVEVFCAHQGELTWPLFVIFCEKPVCQTSTS